MNKCTTASNRHTHMYFGILRQWINGICNKLYHIVSKVHLGHGNS